MARPAITVGESIRQYLDVRSDLNSETLRDVRRLLRRFGEHLGPDLNIRSVTPRHVEEFFTTGKNSRRALLSPGTFNKERNHFAGYVKFCSGRGWFPSMVTDNIRPQKLVPRSKVWLSPRELVFCLDDQDHPRDRLIVAMGLNTALRASEIASLTLGDVDLEQGWLSTTLHKNSKVDLFPINSDLEAELRRWLSWYAAQHGPLDDSMRLVPARRKAQIERQTSGVYRSVAQEGVQPYASCLGYIRVPIHRSLAKLGYPTHQEGLHTLRRSVARVYYDKIVSEGEDDPLRVTQQLLNHSSATTTERYLGVERERRKRDESLRGKPFLSALLQAENVVPIRGVVNGDGSDQG